MIKKNLILIMLFTSVLTTGCVERLITVTTKPQGAIVWLNDQEVGASPVTVPFTWYGRYSVVVRKDGYQTVKTSRKTPVPFCQYPVIDLFTECLLPAKLVDQHQWHIDLPPSQSPDHQELIKRATSTRNQANTEDG